jgi:hypothetical protein
VLPGAAAADRAAELLRMQVPDSSTNAVADRLEADRLTGPMPTVSG